MSLDRATAPDPVDILPVRPSFKVTSTDILDGAPLPTRHVHRTVGGQNVSPQLSWSGFPAQTRSFAVTLFDPDTPNECGFWHWVLIDLPATTHELPSGAGARGLLPEGAIHTRNDFGNNRYDGSAPSAGDVAHRYVFMVHALDVETLDCQPPTPTPSRSARTAPVGECADMPMSRRGDEDLGTASHTTQGESPDTPGRFTDGEVSANSYDWIRA